MVRMSDVVRGIVRDKPVAPAPPRARPVAAQPGTPAPRPEPPSHEVLPHHDEAARAPEMPAESAEPLFTETQLCLARVREIMRTGDAFPWAELERLVERCAASLER